MLSKLFKNNDLNIKRNVIAHENCPIDILKKISNSKSKSTIFILISNKKCPIEILKKLYKKNEDLRKDIIKHPNWNLGDFE